MSGFSGSVRSASTPPPGGSAADKTTIDLDGPVLRVIETGNLGGPPRAQAVPAPKPFTVRAGEVGQVFAIALDDAMPPNIYAAATSAYGLPVVVPDADGDGLPDRARKGAAGAAFMPGLFGPYAEAGPGSIWKIDGTTGQISLFADVTLDGARNSGPALGGLAFDRATRQLFVADRETGMIHAFALDGRETGRFDHGVQGLGAVGLPAIPFDRGKRLDLQSPHSTAPIRRRGLMRRRRGGCSASPCIAVGSIYAVAAGARIWSVSLGPEDAFGTDARVEVVAPPSAVPGTEVSKIVFDDSGQMLIAERGPSSGAYDFGALTTENAGRVLRLRPKPPGLGGTPYFWEPAGEYAIGFLPDHRNGDGGIALGYGIDPAGFANPASCGGMLWTTGSRLRITNSPAVGQRLATGGPAQIDGLQGNAVSLLRPQNTPPFAAYFIDYDDMTDRADTPGHMGDVETWRACPATGVSMPTVSLLIEETWCPVGFVRGGNQCIANPCRPGEGYVRGRCIDLTCPLVARTPIRGLCCPDGKKWNKKTKSCEPSEQTCPPNQRMKSGECCPFPLASGVCRPPPACPPEQRSREGICCPNGVDLLGHCRGPDKCPRERVTNAGVCCPTNTVQGQCIDQKACPKEQQAKGGLCCPTDMIADARGQCVPNQTETCPAGMVSKNGECVCGKGNVIVGGKCGNPSLCDGDRRFDLAQAKCVCRSGREENGACLPDVVIDCTQGRIFDQATRQCVCAQGTAEVSGVCTPSDGAKCKPGTIQAGGKCLTPEPACSNGGVRLLPGGPCLCPSGTREFRGKCMPLTGSNCKPNEVVVGGKCQPPDATCGNGGSRIIPGGPCICPLGTTEFRGKCTSIVTETCGPGQTRNPATRQCECPLGTTATPQGCVRGGGPGDYTIPVSPDTCPGQTRRQADGSCRCPAGSGFDYLGEHRGNRVAVTQGFCAKCEPPYDVVRPDGYCSRPCEFWETPVWNSTGPEGDPLASVTGSSYSCVPKTPLVCQDDEVMTVDGKCVCPPGQSRNSEGVCRPPLLGTQPTCPLGQVRHLGRCCTPESIAAGTCGGSTTPIPPPPVTPVCRPPLVLHNGVCCSVRDIAAGTCGGRPPGLVDPGCKPGQVRGRGGQCEDPPSTPRCERGTRWDGTRCVKPGGESTACQKGFVWDGKRCVRERPAEKSARCGKGSSWDGRSCVKDRGADKPSRCGKGSTWDGRSCVPQKRTPPKQTVPGAKPPPGLRPTKPPGLRPTQPGIGPRNPDRGFMPTLPRGPGGPIRMPGRGR